MAIDTVVVHDHDANIAILVEAIRIRLYTKFIVFLVLINGRHMMIGVVHSRSTTDSSGLGGLDLRLMCISADHKCGDQNIRKLDPNEDGRRRTQSPAKDRFVVPRWKHS